MNNNFTPVLLKSRISGNYMNPGETLWVTLTWQNIGETPAPKDFMFFLDGDIGHQRRLENKRCDFRVTAESMPQTTLWTKGTTVDVTFKWEIILNWSGTFHLRAGMTDENKIPLLFKGKDKFDVYAEYIGSVDVSWNLGRPWVIEYTHAVEKVYNTPIEYITYEEKINPESFIMLGNEAIVKLDTSRPAVIAVGNYHFNYSAPTAVILKSQTGRSFTDRENNCHTDYTLIKTENNTAIYHARTSISDEKAAEFDIVFELSERILKISLKNISEYNGFVLLELKYNVLSEMTDGYLLDFFGSGRLVPIRTSTPVWFEKKYDVRNAAVLYDQNGMIMIESTHIDSKLITGIINVNGQNRGIIGGSIVAAIKAENGIAPIRVKNPPVFEIELVDLVDLQGQTPDWQLAARLLRRGVYPNSARDLYRNVYFYKQLATWGPMPDANFQTEDLNPLTQNLFKTVTFDEITESVRKFSNLTDWAKQVMYVTGWQKGGFDNAYPFPYDAEERCGGLERLRVCLNETRKYNTLSGLHDNFDDISYINSDFPYAAIDERGEKWRGWIWAGGMTYNIGMKKYADSGAMKDRVDKMTSLLPLKDTYHIDVLTAETCRYDFDPENPASAEDNFNAKMQIIEEFNRHGIDVTSELLVHPAVSKIGFALHTRLDADQTFIPGGCFVPLVQMIYHGIIGYCSTSHTKDQILWGLLLGGHTFYEEDITKELCVSRYYIQNIPAMLLYDKKMTAFEHNGIKARADYEDKSFVEVDFAAKKYTVVIDSVMIAKDFTVFVKGNSENSYLAYSFDGGEAVYPMPECFRGHEITAVRRLTEEGETEIPNVTIKTDGGKFIINLPPMTPIKITISN